MIKEILEKEREEKKISGKFSVSGVGGCWRRKYLELKGLYQEKFTEKTKRAFSLGNSFHEQIIKELLEKMNTSDYRIVSAEINIPEQKYISGRIDQLLSNVKTGELLILDCKSCSDWTLNNVRDGVISEKYIWQLQLYLHFFKIKRGILLFVGKSKHDVEEYIVEYDKALCEKLVADIENFFINYVEKNIEPPKCNGGDFGCDCCGIKNKWEKKF